jgi:hypothetical protein
MKIVISNVILNLFQAGTDECLWYTKHCAELCERQREKPEPLGGDDGSLEVK